MKLRDQNLVERSGSLSPEENPDIMRTRFGLDPDSFRDIIGFLTNLYSDKARAVLREYSTNAWDSHIEAGIKRPIEVETPSPLRKELIIRDWGVGMSLDDVMNTYSKYGKSTKRQSDDVVGALGLGCKSGLTYTGMFSIVARKNGVQVTVLVSRGEDGVGDLTVTDTKATDFPNGVEIIIPVSDVTDFSDDVFEFFKFWEPGSVLVNGEAPESIWDPTNPDVLFLDPDVVIVDNLDQNYLVMGNVPYPMLVPKTQVQGDAHIVARVPIGQVDFTPSRESLHLTDRTKEVVQDVAKFVNHRLRQHVQSEINKAETPWEALIVWHGWKEKVSFRRMEYRDEVIPGTVKMSGQSWRVPSYSSSRYKGGQNQTYINLDTGLINGTSAILFGHPPKKMDRDTKSALVAMGNLNQVYIVYRISSEARKWISGATQIKFTDLKIIRPPKARVSRARPEKWLVHTSGMYGWDEKEIEDDAILVYFGKTDNPMAERFSYRKQTREDYREEVTKWFDRFPGMDVTLAMVSASHTERFLKQHPHAQTIEEFLQSTLDKIDAKIPDDVLAWNGTGHPFLRVPDGELLDPSIKAVADRIRTATTDKMKKLLEQRNLLVGGSAIDLVSSGKTAKSTRGAAPMKGTIQQQVDEIMARYPLLNTGFVSIGKNQIDYMNAMYYYSNRRKKGKKKS